MDYTEMLVQILKEHEKVLRQDKGVARFYAKLRDGTADYVDVLKYADHSGMVLAYILGEGFPNGIPPDMAEALLTPALKEECKAVLKYAETVQKSINKRAGLNLNSVNVDVNTDRINGLVEHVKESGIGDETQKLISNLAQSHVDMTIKENARFQERSGLEVTITRTYDGVGLKSGACQWCLDRCGSDVPYKDAVAKGMFERHPGCGCVIEYHTSKGTQRQADWTRNSWIDTDKALETRKNYGL